MNFYQISPASATNADPDTAARRSRFAREAVRLEFRTRDARAIDYGGFRDRQPNEAPRRLA